MSHRLLAALLAAAALCAGAIQVSAKSSVIAQITSPKNHPAVYISRGLVPGHRYHVQIITSGSKVKYNGVASEMFTYILNKRLGTYPTVVKMSATGSRTFTLSVPKSLRRAQIETWLLTAEAASVNSKSPLKLRLIQG